ncbi:MAG: 3D domain-containing protein [Acidobacteriota bacterium]|nr:3D domain-containing protein [Acidobacteriota bacterium]
MKALLGRSAIIASILLLGLIVFSAQPSIAETLFSQFQSQKGESKQNSAGAMGKFEAEAGDSSAMLTKVDSSRPLSPPTNYVATAYSLRGKTASGRMVSRGLIAADPRVLPLGSRVRLEHPGYSGEYLVADTGGMIRGKHIDIWIPSSREAMRFGRRTVKLTVLSYPPRRTRRSAKS